MQKDCHFQGLAQDSSVKHACFLETVMILPHWEHAILYTYHKSGHIEKISELASGNACIYMKSSLPEEHILIYRALDIQTKTSVGY